jgi:putative transposase
LGVNPNDAAITRLVGAVLLEQDEHWQLERRRMFCAESMAAIPELDDLQALLSAAVSITWGPVL